MTPLERALIALAGRLSEINVSYMLVGGMANAVWGEPRATLDIDVTVWVADADIDRLVPALARQFTPRIDYPRRFIEEARVLPLRTSEGQHRHDLWTDAGPANLESWITIRCSESIWLGQRTYIPAKCC